MGNSDSKTWQSILTSRFLVGDHIPDDGAELAASLTEAVGEVIDQPLPAGSIKAVVSSPPNISELRVDLSGQDLELVPEALQTVQGRVSSDVSQEKDRLPATLESAQLLASPVRIEGVPVELTVEAKAVPFNWITDRQGQVSFGLAQDGPGDMSGEFKLGVTKEALRVAVLEAASAAAQAKGFTLQDLDFDIRQSGNTFRIVGSARLRKSILTAQAEALATINYDPNTLRLTVDEVQLSSRNPAVAMLLQVMDSQLAPYRGKTIDLNEALSFTGQEIECLDITIRGNDIRVWGKF